MGRILKRSLRPFQSVCLSFLIFRHLRIFQFQIRAYDMGAHKFLDKFADLARAYGLMKSFAKLLYPQLS